MAVALAAGVLLSAAAPAGAAGPDFALEPVVEGYKRPLYVTAHHSLNRLYVVEQRGIIRVLRRTSPDAPWKKAGIFLDLRTKVRGPFVGRGLLGMAFHPNYAKNGRFYVFFTRRPDGFIEIAEYRRRTGLRARPGSARTVLVIPHPSAYHFGGWIGFGPDDYMYVTTGDAADSSLGYSQDMHSQLGKVLRLNPRAARGSAAAIPADNPFADGVSGDPLVWAAGLRNPWRASFDANGDLWLPDVGQSRFEEVNVFRDYSAGSGANLGWPLCEGGHAYPTGEPPQACDFESNTAPLLEYAHADGDCSIIGGYVYRGTRQPSLVGRYFFADYCTGRIWSVPADYESGPLDPALVTGRRITSFGVDATGELYVTAQSGSVWRIVEQ